MIKFECTSDHTSDHTFQTGKTLFVIPSYQRGYRWNKEDAQKLLRDLQAYSGADYCLQPLEFQVAERPTSYRGKDYDNYIRVVDGQQRLTTLGIMAKCLGIPQLQWDIFYLVEGKMLSELLMDDAKESTINAHFRHEVAEVIDAFEHKELLQNYFCGLEKSIVFPVHFLEKETSEADEQDQGQNAFNRLNAGKTPLTSSELIRALYMVNDSGLDEQQRMEISKEWELIEDTLGNEQFWLMFNAGGLEKTPTRIDLLFALVLDIDLGKTHNNPRLVYETLEAGVYKRKYNLAKVWGEVLRCFWWMQSCYEDVECFNALGWIARCTDIQASTLYKDYRNYSAMPAFKKVLAKKIQESISGIGRQYGDPRLKDLLLLCNVLACNDRKERLHFDLLGKIDIEHIDSQTPNDLSNQEDRKVWLESVFGEYGDLGTGHTREDFIALSAEETQTIIDKIAATTSADDAIEDGNGLGNLVLLDAGINRSYRNAVFPRKRKEIIAAIAKGQHYLLPCTERAFMKFYTTSASAIDRWHQADYNCYERAMEGLMDSFFASIGDLPEPNETHIDLAPSGEQVVQVQEDTPQGAPMDCCLSGDFKFEELMSTYRIRVPKIQRTYVQGRQDTYGKKCLKGFASVLVDSVCNSMPCPLDMVYGIATADKAFYPLDGQQRLTTLLLLAWLCGRTQHGKWSFDYESRRASELFIRNLLGAPAPSLPKDIEVPKDREYPPCCTSYVMAQPWFLPVWKDDPGIAGMLEMLDSLAYRLAKQHSSDKTFDFDGITLNVNCLDVTAKAYDHIFLKMNSRGRQLTTWENVKAVIDKYVPEQSQEWKRNINLEWPEAIWPKVEKDINRLDSNMLAVISEALKYAGYKEKAEDTFELDNWMKDNPTEVKQFFACADTLLSATGVDEGLNKALTPSWSDNPLLPDLGTVGSECRKRLAAYYASRKSANEEWMRVVWNIVENSDAGGNLPAALHLIDKLALHCDDILGFLARDGKVESGFAREQMKEEREKARQVLSQGKLDDAWYEAIKEAEGYSYLKGCISALFPTDECKGGDMEFFRQRLLLLKSLIDDKNDSYHFVKVLISNLSGDFQFNKPISLNRSEANWKNIVVKYFKEAFRRTADAKVSDVTGKPLWIRLLAKTQLLNNSRQEGKIIGKYSDKIVLYGTQGHTWNAYGNVVLDKHHYLPGLSELIEKKEVSDCMPVPGTSVFSEWDVFFSVDGNEFLISSGGNLKKKHENGQWVEIGKGIAISEQTSAEELRALL